jgi:hypothetical protein
VLGVAVILLSITNKKNYSMKRKDFLKSVALGAMSSSVLLAACGGGSNQQTTAPATEPTPAPQAATGDCNDTSGLTEADLQQRQSLGYVAQSNVEGKNCTNCRFYQEGSQENGCGGCQLFKGSVLPEGYCNSWFAKA